MAGGWDNFFSLATSELFNPATGLWDVTPGALSTARDTHSATRLNNGQVLVAGGEDSWCMPLASCQVFDPTTKTWSTKGNLSSPRNGHTATLLKDGRVLVAGGYNISSTPATSTP